MSTHFKYTLLILIIAFLGFAAGYFAGQAQVAQPAPSVQPVVSQPAVKTPVKKGSYEQGYEEALDFARRKLMEEGEFEPRNSLTATVKSVSGQNIVVEFDATLLDPFAEGMVTKTIAVGGDTQLYERLPKDEEEFKKEYEAFEKAIQDYETAFKANPEGEGLEEPEEPQEYTVKTLTASDFMAGDRVRIRADLIAPEKVTEGEEAGEAMMMISPFESDTVQATEVRLYSRPEPEPEKELPTPIEEEMKEAPPEEAVSQTEEEDEPSSPDAVEPDLEEEGEAGEAAEEVTP